MLYQFIAFNDTCTLFKYFLHDPNVAILTSEEEFLYNLRVLGKQNSSASYHKFTTDAVSIHRTLNMDSSSGYLPQVSEVIRRLVESGIVNKIVDDMVDPSGLWKRIKARDNLLDSFVPLSLFHMFSCFSLLVSHSVFLHLPSLILLHNPLDFTTAFSSS